MLYGSVEWRDISFCFAISRTAGIISILELRKSYIKRSWPFQFQDELNIFHTKLFECFLALLALFSSFSSISKIREFQNVRPSHHSAPARSRLWCYYRSWTCVWNWHDTCISFPIEVYEWEIRSFWNVCLPFVTYHSEGWLIWDFDQVHGSQSICWNGVDCFSCHIILDVGVSIRYLNSV